MTVIREQLLTRFVPHAEAELTANAWKGDSWRSAGGSELSNEVLYHAAKLDLAVRLGSNEAILEHAADVANCAAMLADRFGLVDQEPRDVSDLKPVEYIGLGGPDLHAHVDAHQASLGDFVVGEPAEATDAA